MSLSHARPGFQIPILSSIGRDIERDPSVIFYLLAIAATILVLAVQTWGLVVLTLTALCLVPLMFVFFVLITWP
ncbi:hypothetical protein [Tabrizicola sp.]|uniref:hypothetical protein n=1 Tax=Tabrizicola sp. TaxID=2005166 RepID=UPI003D27EAEF